MNVRIEQYTAEKLSSLLPHPKVDANKYSRGKLTIVGGASVYPGAVCLSSVAAQLMGAGYVEVFCSSESVPIVQSWRPSVVARDWETFDVSKLSASHHFGACLVGPGIDAGDVWQLSTVLSIVEKAQVPLIVDGGAISALSTVAGIKLVSQRNIHSVPLVITPHLGEATYMADAAGICVPDTDSGMDKYASFSAKLSDAFNAVVLLKGPVSFIGSPSTPSCTPLVFCMKQGISSLAKAGSGDVLAGMVGSLLAQGLEDIDACVLGATLHAEAGRAAQAKLGDISVCAEDVAFNIPDAILCCS
ncbi:NAD(P)H-hydrate dehydratase [Adlercreutzia sp. ZJ154]|uniref:NAD(P)H-hydrate dehydratase n=1 Tax=Adlercreutzia sp. ZJ154 TaxID=2709790 RepID=UPI0013E9CCB0|nr:NAD(P)H-hydrate dehydratase [Adlercreutzia sp. ZJ154]